MCSQVSGQLRFNRHDALKRKVVKLDGYGPHGRMDLMVSIPPAGDVRPVDVGFTAAAQNSALPAASTDPDVVTTSREAAKTRT